MNKSSHNLIIICLFVSISICIFSSCGSSGGDKPSSSSDLPTDSPSDLPPDIETQPPYSGSQAFLKQDSDNDGVSDYMDFYPLDASKTTVQIMEESEVNNNISLCNDILNDGLFPIGINAKLENGITYRIDSDYFKITAQEGQKISIIIVQGEMGSIETMLNLSDIAACKPAVTVFDEQEEKINGNVLSLFNDTITGLGLNIPETGDYYVSITDLKLVASEYTCPYTVMIVEDIDFDGLSDNFEDIIGSNKEDRDTDDDGIDDFIEAYPFIMKFSGINKAAIDTTSVNWWDSDNDGIPNWYDVDSDGDGIPDRLEHIVDFDRDLIPGFIDSDANDDNIFDKEQSGGSYQYPIDSDGDGIPDFADIDIDNDAIPNTIDSNPDVMDEVNDLYADDALYLHFVEAVTDSTEPVENMMIGGNTLYIHGKGLSTNVNVLFPIAGGSYAVEPHEYTDNILSVTTPLNVVDGTIYVLDGKKLSNGVYATASDMSTSSFIYSIDPEMAEPGDIILISGNNLSQDEVAVIFSDGQEKVKEYATAQNEYVQVTVPPDAKTGKVYLEVTEDMSTNSLPITVQTMVGVHVALSGSLPYNYTHLSILANGQDTALDSDYEAFVSVENHNVDYLASFADVEDSSGLLYEAVVLPDDFYVELSSLSTASKWVFSGLQYPRSQPQENWKYILEIIEETPETASLADHIDFLLKNDHTSLSRFDDSILIQKLHDAQISSAEAIADLVGVSFFTKSNMHYLADELTTSSEITPSSIQSEVQVETDSKANINIMNRNNMFLSVKAETDGKRMLSNHIESPLDNNPRHGLIGRTGWIFNTSKKLLSHGEDAHLEVITGGQGGSSDLTMKQQKVHELLVQRTIVDGLIAPAIDAAMKRIAGKNVRANIIIEMIGPTQWTNVFTTLENNPDGLYNVLKGITKQVFIDNGFLACYQDALSQTCKSFLAFLAKGTGLTTESLKIKLASTIGKKAAAYLIPYIGQAYAVYDNAGLAKTATGIVLTIGDFLSVNKKIDFDVKFGLIINDVFPICVTNEISKVTINALGVTPVKKYIWFGEFTNPKVDINGRELRINYISNPFMHMPTGYTPQLGVDFEYGLEDYKRFLTILMSNEDKKHIGDGVAFLTLSDKDEKVQYKDMQFGIKSLLLNKLIPSKGKAGMKVQLSGCGFSEKAENNDVWFACDIQDCPFKRVKANVIEAKRDSLIVSVPDEAITGEVYAVSKFDTGSITSNPQTFTVEVDVSAQCIVGYYSVTYCSYSSALMTFYNDNTWHISQFPATDDTGTWTLAGKELSITSDNGVKFSGTLNDDCSKIENGIVIYPWFPGEEYCWWAVKN